MDVNLSELEAKAESGDAGSQYALGSLLFNGDGCVQDFAAALKWFMRAAEQDHAKAQERVADCFNSGSGVVQDFSEAFKWYKKSSNLGNAAALCSMGYCYEYGQGAASNPAEALACYKKAAELRNIDAVYSVVNYYIKAEKNYPEALVWLNRIKGMFPYHADGEFKVDGYPGWFSVLGGIFEKGIEEPDACGNVIEKDLVAAYFIYRIGVNANDTGSILSLLFMNTSKNACLVKDKEAASFAMRGAALGDAYSECFLGEAYSAGRGVPKSAVEAVKWWTKAAYQDVCDAQYKLGLAFQEGVGVARDPIEAYVWLNLAAAPHDSKCKGARDLLEVSLTPDQLVSAQKRSTEIHLGFKYRSPFTGVIWSS